MPFFKRGRAQTRQFTEEKALTFKPLKGCSISLIRRELYRKAVTKYCFTHQMIDKGHKV